MGDEKTFSYDHTGEEAWNIRWVMKKPFPMTVQVKNHCLEYQMGDKKTISYDHRGEEAISWNIRWAMEKLFPMNIEVKKQ